MRVAKTVLTFLVLALWLPCTVRCELEKLKVVPTPSCCDEHGSAHSDHAPSPSSDCAVCESVASGYVAQDVKISIPVATINVLVLFDLADKLFVEPMPLATPPEENFRVGLNTWQFRCRSALPPRAPSFRA